MAREGTEYDSRAKAKTLLIFTSPSPHSKYCKSYHPIFGSARLKKKPFLPPRSSIIS